jgi:thymidylate synthase ThyX
MLGGGNARFPIPMNIDTSFLQQLNGRLLMNIYSHRRGSGAANETASICHEIAPAFPDAHHRKKQLFHQHMAPLRLQKLNMHKGFSLFIVVAVRA